jgi:hypothetical protein
MQSAKLFEYSTQRWIKTKRIFFNAIMEAGLISAIPTTQEIRRTAV